MEATPPRRRTSRNTAKLTVYIDQQVFDLYTQGKANGWDTAAIVRNALSRALIVHAEKLRLNADLAHESDD